MYLAHLAEDGREQSVLEHDRNVAKLAAGFAAPFSAEKLAELAGLLHDIGKYSDAFQRRIRGTDIRVDHATAGAWECIKLGQLLAAFCIAGHHGQLPELGTSDDRPELPTLSGRIERAKQGKLASYDPWRSEIIPPKVPPRMPSGPLDDFFFIRMLYSCLVDADYLDTERFMQGEVERGGGLDMAALDQCFQQKIQKWFPPKGALNERRCTILERCTDQGERQPPGLFTLTVPTGGGKTTASLAFALRHARTHGLKRVVYVIPYTSIIEQTAAEFRKFLGAENVLEHHSGVTYDTDAMGEIQPENARFLRATENWDMPVIVTTAVQFFESLYADRPSKCRKLHNLAGSVIIFDEAQMLPLSYLRPCVLAIAQLVAHYGASAVLCTATQPALRSVFQEFLPNRSAIELCPPTLAGDGIFRRVTFKKAGRMSWEELTSALNKRDQVLCIVNSRKNAQEVYSRLQGEGCFHLSTLMCPAHRRSVLEKVRQRLKSGLPCRVVSTSLIEAGVDVDFPEVFREEAGLDSILQAAGRCNREGKRKAEDSIVTIFQAETAPPPLFDRAIGAAQDTMDQYDDLLDPSAVTHYFMELLDLSGKAAQDKESILDLIKSGGFPFRRVAERFHIIDNDTRTIYIPIGEGAELVEQLRIGDFSRELFRKLGQYSVSVYDQHFQTLERAGALKLLQDGECAVLTDVSLYSKTTGLSLEADYGRALMV